MRTPATVILLMIETVFQKKYVRFLMVRNLRVDVVEVKSRKNPSCRNTLCGESLGFTIPYSYPPGSRVLLYLSQR